MNVRHVHGLGPDGLCHDNAVAGAAHRVGGQNFFAHVGVVLLAHFNIGAKTTGCKHYRFGVVGDLLPVIGGFYAHYVAVFILQQLGGLSV